MMKARLRLYGHLRRREEGEPGQHSGDLTVSKRTGTSNRIEIQFRTFKHLSRPDSFAKLFETLCLCLAQGNKCLGQI